MFLELLAHLLKQASHCEIMVDMTEFASQTCRRAEHTATCRLIKDASNMDYARWMQACRQHCEHYSTIEINVISDKYDILVYVVLKIAYLFCIQNLLVS